jgi:hypothetical protein
MIYKIIASITTTINIPNTTPVLNISPIAVQPDITVNRIKSIEVSTVVSFINNNLRVNNDTVLQ